MASKESVGFISLSFPVPSHQHKETRPYVPSSKLQLYLDYPVVSGGRPSTPWVPTSAHFMMSREKSKVPQSFFCLRQGLTL